MRRVLSLIFITFIFSGCAAESSTGAHVPLAQVATSESEYRNAMSLYLAADRTGDHTGYRAAIAAYEKFLAENLGSEHTYDAVFFDGEARWAIEDWAGAAAKYQRAIALRPADEKSQAAAYANVLATRRAAGISEAEDDPKCDDTSDTDEAAVPDGAAPIVDAYDLFLATTNDSPEIPTVLFSKARILYSCRRFEEAEPLFTKVVDTFGDSSMAAPAAALLLDCLAEQGKTEAMFARAAMLEKTPLASNRLLVKVLADVEAAKTNANVNVNAVARKKT